MPSWLKTMLVAVGLLILVALLTEPVLAALRRRQKAALQARWARHSRHSRASARPAGPLHPARAAPDRSSIVLADHDRLVVTCNKTDQTVYVLRPPAKTLARSCGSPGWSCPKARTGNWPGNSGWPPSNQSNNHAPRT